MKNRTFSSGSSAELSEGGGVTLIGATVIESGRYSTKEPWISIDNKTETKIWVIKKMKKNKEWTQIQDDDNEYEEPK
jgi:hypothetical protein